MSGIFSYPPGCGGLRWDDDEPCEGLRSDRWEAIAYTEAEYWEARDREELHAAEEVWP
jgi:hypothetical protein